MKNNVKFYDAILDEIAKGAKNKINFKKMTFFFGNHPMVEKSPPATDIHTYLYLVIFYFKSYPPSSPMVSNDNRYVKSALWNGLS